LNTQKAKNVKAIKIAILDGVLYIKGNPKNFHRKAYGNIKDLILFYSKAESPIWNDPRVPFSEEDKKRLFKKLDKSGRQ